MLYKMKVLIVSPKRSVNYIGNLSIDYLYENIGRLQDNDMVWSYLKTIARYEKETSELFSNFFKQYPDQYYSRDMRKNYIFRQIVGKMGLTIDKMDDKDMDQIALNLIKTHYFPVANFYGDVFSADTDWDNLYTDYEYREKAKCHILMKDNVYVGHIYSWEKYHRITRWETDPNTLLAQYIRTSLLNHLYESVGERVKGVAYYLIDSVVQYAKIIGKTSVSVIMPLSSMTYILVKYGFKEGRYFIFDVSKKSNITLEEYKIQIY